MKKNTKHTRYTVGEWLQDEVQAWWAWVYVGGNSHAAEMICREMCFPQGLCVTIKPVRYIFAGGTEDGVQIGLIQYPPFPESEPDLLNKAIEVGKAVAEGNFQWSFSVVTPNKNVFLSRRRK